MTSLVLISFFLLFLPFLLLSLCPLPLYGPRDSRALCLISSDWVSRSEPRWGWHVGTPSECVAAVWNLPHNVSHRSVYWSVKCVTMPLCPTTSPIGQSAGQWSVSLCHCAPQRLLQVSLLVSEACHYATVPHNISHRSVCWSVKCVTMPLYPTTSLTGQSAGQWSVSLCHCVIATWIMSHSTWYRSVCCSTSVKSESVVERSVSLCQRSVCCSTSTTGESVVERGVSLCQRSVCCSASTTGESVVERSVSLCHYSLEHDLRRLLETSALHSEMCRYSS